MTIVTIGAIGSIGTIRGPCCAVTALGCGGLADEHDPANPIPTASLWPTP